MDALMFWSILFVVLGAVGTIGQFVVTKVSDSKSKAAASAERKTAADAAQRAETEFRAKLEAADQKAERRHQELLMIGQERDKLVATNKALAAQLAGVSAAKENLNGSDTIIQKLGLLIEESMREIPSDMAVRYGQLKQESESENRWIAEANAGNIAFKASVTRYIEVIRGAVISMDASAMVKIIREERLVVPDHLLRYVGPQGGQPVDPPTVLSAWQMQGGYSLAVLIQPGIHAPHGENSWPQITLTDSTRRCIFEVSFSDLTGRKLQFRMVNGVAVSTVDSVRVITKNYDEGHISPEEALSQIAVVFVKDCIVAANTRDGGGWSNRR